MSGLAAYLDERRTPSTKSIPAKVVPVLSFDHRAIGERLGLATEGPKEDEFLTMEEACELFGGKSKPIHRATLYKGIEDGKYPKPVKPGPQTSRWLKSECIAARRKIIEARGEAFAEASDKMVNARKRRGR